MNSRIKDVRKSLGMTQEQFSSSLGVSRSNLTNIEVGKIQLTDRIIKTICSVYNVNENWIRTGEDKMFNDIDDNDELSLLIGELYAEEDDFKKKVIKTMLSLGDSDWKVIKSFVERMKD